jgi:hypothetical protein
MGNGEYSKTAGKTKSAMKEPKSKDRNESGNKDFKTEFGWEFTPEGLLKDEPHYHELLKRNYNYNHKLYEIHKVPKPKKQS